MLFGNLAPGGAIIKRSTRLTRVYLNEKVDASSLRLWTIWRRASMTLTSMSLRMTFWFCKTRGRKAPLPCLKPAIYRSRTSWPAMA